MEKQIAGTNITAIHKYPQAKGIYIQCMPNPHCTHPPAYEFTESGLSICVAYDFDSGRPESIIGALLQTEYWSPNNPYGIRMSCREDALRFLLGQQVQPHFELNNILPQLYAHMLYVPLCIHYRASAE